MSNTVKIIIGVLVIIVLIAIVYSRTSNSASGNPQSNSGTSDQALKQDAAAIDSQIKGLDNDSATINEGLSQNVSAQ